MEFARQTNDQFASPSVAHASRRRYIGRHVNKHRQHPIFDVRADTLCIVDTVLQAQNHGIFSEIRTHFLGGAVGIEALHAKQNELCAADRSDIGRGSDRYMCFKF